MLCLLSTRTFNNVYHGVRVLDGGKVGGKQSFVRYVRGVPVSVAVYSNWRANITSYAIFCFVHSSVKPMLNSS